jgi:hypothetical protein
MLAALVRVAGGETQAMKGAMMLTDLAVVVLALGGGVVGLVMLGLWALTDFAPPDSEDR